jgi:hypothetical protein
MYILLQALNLYMPDFLNGGSLIWPEFIQMPAAGASLNARYC